MKSFQKHVPAPTIVLSILLSGKKCIQKRGGGACMSVGIKKGVSCKIVWEPLY